MPPADIPDCARCPVTGAGFMLIVDDDPEIRAILEIRLAHAGYRVVAVANGREALERLAAGPRPCLILPDLAMPVMDGWQFMEERARCLDLASIPVVVMSGSIDQRAEAFDAMDHLHKPFEFSRLLRVVRNGCRHTAGAEAPPRRAVP